MNSPYRVHTEQRLPPGVDSLGRAALGARLVLGASLPRWPQAGMVLYHSSTFGSNPKAVVFWAALSVFASGLGVVGTWLLWGRRAFPGARVRPRYAAVLGVLALLASVGEYALWVRCLLLAVWSATRTGDLSAWLPALWFAARVLEWAVLYVAVREIGAERSARRLLEATASYAGAWLLVALFVWSADGGMTPPVWVLAMCALPLLVLFALWAARVCDDATRELDVVERKWWSAEADGRRWASLMRLGSGRVLAATDQGAARCFGAERGAEQWLAQQGYARAREPARDRHRNRSGSSSAPGSNA